MYYENFSVFRVKKILRFPVSPSLFAYPLVLRLPVLYPRPFSILLVRLLLPSLLMLGRPEAAPRGNNKTQGTQCLLQSEDMVLWGGGGHTHGLSVCGVA